jgi:hypothetical protein
VPRHIDPPVSERVGLARLARDVIDSTPGVTATAGPTGRWQTIGSRQAIPGVLAVDGSDGRVDIELHLLARWPPLMALEQIGEQLRAHLRRRAAAAGQGERLGAVSVAFEDILVETDLP